MKNAIWFETFGDNKRSYEAQGNKHQDLHFDSITSAKPCGESWHLVSRELTTWLFLQCCKYIWTDDSKWKARDHAIKSKCDSLWPMQKFTLYTKTVVQELIFPDKKNSILSSLCLYSASLGSRSTFGNIY